MNRIIRNITTVLVGIVVWTCLSKETQAQCKADNGDPVKGEFSINGTKVSVKGDGGGSLTAANNIPIKICEGELITLKNTLSVNAVTSNSYWITELSAYNSRITSLASSTASIDAKYNTIGGEIDVRLISKSTDPKGIGFYNGPGKYVITQYDNTSSTLGGPGFHHACQVIEVIAPKAPLATVKTCTDSEFQIVIPTNANNIFDDYEVTFTPVTGIGEVTKNTGKQTLPYTLKALMPDNRNRVINIKGVSATGGCVLAPSLNLGQKTVNATSLDKPNIISIAGTKTKAEFDIKLGSQIGTTWNFYRRDVTDPLNYNNYTNHFLQLGSISTGVTELVRVTVPNADKQYCFQASAVDLVCGTNEISNQEICTTPANVIPEKDKNVISWLKANGGAPAGVNPTPFINYRVELMRVDGTVDQTLFASNSMTDLSFEHQPVICGNDYIYRVWTNYGSLSYSQIIKVKAVSDDIPSKIPLIYTTINVDDQNAVNIQGLFMSGSAPTDILSYHLYKSETKNGTYHSLTSAKMQDNGLFTDKSAEIEKKSYCYYMTYKNLCNLESEPSDKVCTVYLTGNGNSVNWTTETPFSEPVGYYIAYQIDPKTNRPFAGRPTLVDNFKGNSTDKISRLPEVDGQEIFIQIHAEPSNTGLGGGNGRLGTSESNIFKIFRPSLTMSPQIFTPNGDKVNDKFLVEGRFIKSLKMTIYDRWGNAIFYEEQTNYPFQGNQNPDTVIGWDGLMNNGNKAMEGSYVFKIEVEDTIGQISTKEGALLLAY